jgi:hypothetical protein
MRKATFVALLALGMAQAVEAARPACIERGDMRTLIAVALPDAIEGLATRCSSALPPDAFLPNEGAGLAARYRHETPVDPVRARHAIEAATGQDLSSFASDDTVTNLARTFVGQQINDHVSLRDCGTIDNVISLAAPLKAHAMVEAIVLALQVAGPEQTKGLAICRPKDEGASR